MEIMPLSKYSVSDCKLKLFFWHLIWSISEISGLVKYLSLSNIPIFSQSNVNISVYVW